MENKHLKCEYINDKGKRCKVNIELISFDCKCTKKFCTKHKYPEIHNCSFDYKEHGKKYLEKTLTKVLNVKIPII